MSINFVSCLTWVPRGKAKAIPETLQYSQEDVQRMIDETKGKLAGMNPNVQQQDMEMEDMDEDEAISRRYGLENYDDDDDDLEEDEENQPPILGNLGSMAVYASNADDPYLQQQGGPDSDSEDERDNFEIKPGDNLILAGHVEGESSSLEVHVYNKEQDDFYPHHDIVLGAYPLCFEWLSLPNLPNCVACGDMTADISIWNLDVVNLLEAGCKLTGHSDSVISLSWDGSLSLASGSADKHVFLWDLENSCKKMDVKKCKGRVQGVSFHPQDKNVVLLGDDKGNASVTDIRSSNSSKTWTLSDSEVEGIIWDELRPTNFFVATDKGNVIYFDSRVETSSVYSLNAHNEAVTGIVQSPVRKDCLVTTSSDKTLKIWNISSGDRASFVVQHPKVNVGKILTLTASPDDPFVFAIGGDAKSNNFRVLDISGLKAVKEAFGLQSVTLEQQ